MVDNFRLACNCTHVATSFNTFLTRSIQLVYLSCIKHFGLPVFVGCPVYRNVNDEDSFFGICLKLIYISTVSSEMTFTDTENVEKSFYHDRHFPVIVRNKLT